MTHLDKIWYALVASWGYATGNFVWYAFMAGGVWLGFYVLLRRRLRYRKVIPRLPTIGQQGWEVAPLG